MQYKLGNLIRQYRRRAGISQLELEIRIDAAFSSISKIEAGKVDLSKETLNKIVSALNLTTYEAA
jgi:transcriptional regulator with XRE-family HTH domain